MIDRILNDIDNEECYYVGVNGCLYQDLDKEELFALKQEIERLNNIINELEKELEKDFHTFMCNSREVGKIYKAGGNVYREHILLRLRELKGSDNK